MKNKFIFVGTQEEEERLVEQIRNLKEQKEENQNLLHKSMFTAQEIYGYLPIEVQRIIARELGLRLKDVYEAATFYHDFKLIPRGKYHMVVCDGTACHMNHSEAVLEKIFQNLELQPGECTADRMFSLETVHCMGACGVSPALKLNNTVYGKMNAEKTEALIRDCVEREKKEAEEAS